MKLSHTGIEYAVNRDGSRGYGWNFYPGCLHRPQGKCQVTACWAEAMWKRQMGAAAKKGITLPDFHHPHLIPELLLAPLLIKKPSTILVNFMGDLFGDWVDSNHPVTTPDTPDPYQTPDGKIHIPCVRLKTLVYDIIRKCPQHTFFFLTKNPAGLISWSPFPPNCLVGASVCNQQMLKDTFMAFRDLPGRKFLSFEPLLDSLTHDHYLPLLLGAIGISWLVIGAETKNGRIVKELAPKVADVCEIVAACEKAGVPVFLKDNLRELFRPLNPDDCTWGWRESTDGLKHLRQEYPTGDATYSAW